MDAEDVLYEMTEGEVWEYNELRIYLDSHNMMADWDAGCRAIARIRVEIAA